MAVKQFRQRPWKLQYFSCVKLCSIFRVSNSAACTFWWQMNAMELNSLIMVATNLHFWAKSKLQQRFVMQGCCKQMEHQNIPGTSTVTTNGLSTRQDTQHIECDNNSFKIAHNCVTALCGSCFAILIHITMSPQAQTPLHSYAVKFRFPVPIN